jgi:carbonic anhydrase/acetyltransferase-like protein (isoleucine patch superfamily)
MQPFIYDYMGKYPKISPNSYIAPNCSIIGDVEIQDGVSIWFSCTIRGDINYIRIGKNSNIQDNTVIHVDHIDEKENKPKEKGAVIIGENVTIGHSAIIHACKIEDNTLIGMGAIVLSGAKIGKNCIIGAGAVVRENDIIPDNSLAVGIPAKVIRRLPIENEYALKEHSKKYLKYAQSYQIFRRNLS